MIRLAALFLALPGLALAQATPTPTLREAVLAGEGPVYAAQRCAGFLAHALASASDDLPPDLRQQAEVQIGLLIVTSVDTLEENGLDRATAEDQVFNGVSEWSGFYGELLEALPDPSADPLFRADGEDCALLVGR